jgi:site-specific DNA-methyltransferase (adenine-specific)
MVANILGAGFELQDIVLWSYGSGFPKSLDVSKAIDKAAGSEREVISEKKTNSGGMAHISKTNAEHGFRPAAYNGHSLDDSAKNCIQVTAPATPEAQQWAGWGTALKPAYEPVSIFTKGGSLTLHAEPKRLYYCAKAAKKERNLGLTADVTNTHPTVKPLKLMESLCELATPKGGVILDPFMGSGTTGIAALNMGYNFIGIDMGEEYFDIASCRLNSLFPKSEAQP